MRGKSCRPPRCKWNAQPSGTYLLACPETQIRSAAYYEQCLPTTDASGRTSDVHHAPRAQQSAGAESSRGEIFRIHVSELGVTAEETGRHACVWREPGKGFYIYIC